MSAMNIAAGRSLASDDDFVSAERRAVGILALLFFFGLIAFAAVQSLRLEQPQCKPFTIGQSAIGGCDWIEDISS
jgi:hypothetical protein